MSAPGCPPALTWFKSRPRMAGVLLALTLLLGACATPRDVLMDDPEARRSVVLLKETDPPGSPPDPQFAQLSALELEASLARIIIRPGTWSRIALGDPETLLSAEQIAWARDALAPRLPKLPSGQRIELRFEDRFKGYENRMEVYPEGESLVYRFTRLMAEPDPDVLRGMGNKPLAFGELQEQPGQRYDFDRNSYYLRDRVFGRGDAEQLLAEKLALVQRALDAGRATEAQLAPIRKVLEERPAVSRAALERYLERLEVLNKAREQGLFSAAEAAERERRLLDELAGR